MKLATLKNGTRDGKLIVVSRDNKTYADASDIAPNLQHAMDDWNETEPKLRARFMELEKGVKISGRVDVEELAAPLPRAYEWVDGSAYINHIVLVRKARGAEPPATLRTEPLVYQGGSSFMLGPHDPITIKDPAWGLDFESEVCVILGDTPQGTSKSEAHKYIRLVMLCNDVSLRNLVPAELEKGFGFFQSKPASHFSPFAITPDELGDAWREGRIHLPLITHLNGKKFGDPDAGKEMHFSFFDLIEHMTKTRAFTAGTILGSGTVSNEDRGRGSSCLVEVRMIEKISTGAMTTPFLKSGDTVTIEMLNAQGQSLFGKIDQDVVKL